MPPKAKKAAAPPKADVTKEAGKQALSAIDDNTQRIRSLRAAGNGHEADQVARAVENSISALSGKGVTAVKADKRKELREALATPVTAPAVPGEPGWAEFDGARERVNHAVTVAKDAVSASKTAAGRWLRVSEEVLEIRLAFPDENTGLPDLTGRRKYTRNAVSDMYQSVWDSLDDSDEVAGVAFRAMKNSVREHSAETLIRWLRALDGFPPDAASQADRVGLIRQYFPEIADRVEAGTVDSAAEAVYDLYESQGVALPRKTRTELRRESRQVERVLELRAAAEDEYDDKRAAELERQAREIAAQLPEDALEPAHEKTPQERAFERIARERGVFEKMLKRKPKTSDERRDLAERLESLGGWLTGQAAALRKE